MFGDGRVNIKEAKENVFAAVGPVGITTEVPYYACT